MKSIVLVLAFSITVHSYDYTSINLPEHHLPFYFSNFPTEAARCESDPQCPYKRHLNSSKCWGYEPYCKWDKKYSIPACPGDHRGWVRTKFDQQNTFYTQADFGYIKDQLREMRLLCEPLFPHDSSLECSEHLRFCSGRNILMNFTALLDRTEPLRYKMDIFRDGDIGGHCDFHRDKLEVELDHISALQSWGPEMRFFRQLRRPPIEEGDCDVVIRKPTFIMKIDATVNMYHHFCDFFNLYASLHVNGSHPSTFSTDVHILIWESFKYNSAFADTWRAFTAHPIWDLNTFRGKTVCFKNVVFPLLPRMIFGLYYNTPLIYGCEGSGLFHAFSSHVLHRLRVSFNEREDDRVRITFLSRDTKYRRILNEDALIAALEANDEYVVQKVVYNRSMDFMEQLEITRNTDVFIGIHGAGLTHLLFLPDWAAVFEVYNCEDQNCYLDLARLRGVKYITWENETKLTQENEGTHPDGGAHAKFTNYSFDVQEFLFLVAKAAKHVVNHSKFKEAVAHVDRSIHDEL